ncbi:uncharacterized protein CC84DRAFT_886100 [Paraphaeosphaeria sporulosa]|uniref:gamma-glutamylcyclotransferase n=1 Tax=Paraphaeosphaeria sporulosa TaxID=1460663 RepID=A0A177C8U4_9PLEO|nr:uncharacterized protein CC84DRAFT_886100 [Paraphaeosphaeria sporulosa]OAG04063.1 hypothetical protein CC84DRAFT_886100 [Paraphaeosphaeria sporulosa]
MMPPRTAPQKTLAEPTLYFAFGSNLWLSQMRTRCPSSAYLGVARLHGYTWIINERGYANVVESKARPIANTKPDHVYGLVFRLDANDEAKLDKNEGVPIAYTKECLSVDFWAARGPNDSVDTTRPPTEVGQDMLVYIDRRRVTPSTPKDEYVYRINRGVEDAVRLGVPNAYIEGTVRRFVPAEEEGNKGRKSVEEVAKKQAAGFVDKALGVDGES